MKSIKDGEPYPLWLPGEPTLKQVDILKNTLHMRKIFIYEENTLNKTRKQHKEAHIRLS